MSTDTSVRRLLPQNSQLQTFSFAPTSFVPRENQKNYVFVDEHNRHKRLKVMRACEGCRRRKIKCDAATTNTWPCSACIRLKLHCVPPTVNYDSSSSQGFEPDRGGYESSSGDDDYHNPLPLHQHLGGPHKATSQPMYAQHIPFADTVNVYHSLPYSQHPQGHVSMQPAMHFNHMQDATDVIESHYPQVQTVFPVGPVSQPQAPSPEYDQDHFGKQDLADVLRDLKVDSDGSAPYLSSRRQRTQVEEPAFEDLDDYKHNLPPITSGPDLKVRIPPELMPSEETVMQYFDIYFANVHPYVPVLNKNHFYQQWHNNRESISPLILEAVFAIGGRLTDEPSEGQQWLALAGKHVNSFMDVPRLSTLQGMLILLKAQESTPKRGYYYRSWMSVVQSISMAKDLGLDEHHEDHKAGKSCGSDAVDCTTKSRIWEMLFVCETMIGSAQGRTGLSIDTDSLDWSVPRPVSGEDAEYNVARNFFYFKKLVRNVRVMSDAYSRLKKNKDWGIDPQLTQLVPSTEAWVNDLPSDLQINFPVDGSPPWIPSHFLGNLHCYYYLSIILIHRPQMNLMDPSDPDGQWKHHMMICYSAVKALCRLQEAILQYFGLLGILSMQRGISFTIYCILTSTMVHLIAVTSPDPDLNNDAREFFTRHMRVLEECAGSWTMVDVRQQIDALREALSADTRKPFVLKPFFPYGSPVEPAESSPAAGGQYRAPQLVRSSSMEQNLDQHHPHQQPQVSYTTHPITPPISAGGLDTKSDSPVVQSLVMMATGQRGSQQQQQQQQQQAMFNTVSLDDPSLNWNSSRIFDQWNSTFGTPSTQASSTSIPLPLKVPSSCSLEPLTVPELHTSGSLPLPQESQPLATQQYSGASMPPFVSPSMWQDSVTNVYDVNLKRQWDYDGMGLGTHGSKRSR